MERDCCNRMEGLRRQCRLYLPSMRDEQHEQAVIRAAAPREKVAVRSVDMGG